MARLPAPRDGVLVEPFGDGAVVFEPVSALLHRLNPEAALVVQGCSSGWSMADLVDDVARASGVEPAQVAADIETCLAELRHVGILTDPAAAAAGPSVGGRQIAQARDSTPELAEPFSSRSFAVLDEVVVIRSSDRDVLDRVDALFEDLVVARAPTQAWSLTFGADSVRLAGPHERTAAYHHADALLDHLPTLLNEVAATSTTCLALHAGVVRAPNGDVMLLPGVSGSGKSTLTAWLVQQGWGYLSDETAAIRTGSLTMTPYPKPLTLDDTSRSLLGLDQSTSPLVRAAALRPGAAVSPDARPPAGRIVLLSYRANAPTTLVRLESGAAVLAVAEHALNLRRVGSRGLATLVDLISTVPCHRLTHGRLSDAQAALEALPTTHG